MTNNPLRAHWLLATLTLAVALAFAGFVWPTPFRYDHIQMNGGNFPVRTNRFTQNVDIMTYHGWERMEKGPPAGPLDDLFKPAQP